MRSRTLAAAILPFVLAGCSRDADRSQASNTVPPATAFSGAVATPARAKPAFTFTLDSGRTYDFQRETTGKLTYLFFGYTNCPDVCPTHMANLGAVYKKLPYSDQQRIRVLFVTTDPKRDTPERMRTWLANFSPDFIGVSGPMDEINRLQGTMGMPPAVPEAAPAGSKAGQYGVAHGAAIMAFTPDDSLRILYPFGIRQQDLAKDLPLLLRIGAK